MLFFAFLLTLFPAITPAASQELSPVEVTKARDDQLTADSLEKSSAQHSEAELKPSAQKETGPEESNTNNHGSDIPDSDIPDSEETDLEVPESISSVPEDEENTGAENSHTENASAVGSDTESSDTESSDTESSDTETTKASTINTEFEAAESQGSDSKEDSSSAEEPTSPDGNEQILNPNEQNRIQQSLNQNPWVFLHAYDATYEISADGDKLGNASRKMSQDSGKWTLEISSKLKKWFLTMRSREYSQFEIQDEQLRTTEFYSSTKLSFKKDRTVKQFFDWSKKLETGTRGKKDWTLPLDEPLFDRMSHFIKLRSDLLLNKQEFNYLISYKGKRKYYQYSRADSETLTTSFGEFETIKMVRTSGDDSSFTVWFSPELNYFPIKIAQFEQDKPDVVMTLTKLEFLSPVEVASQ